MISLLVFSSQNNLKLAKEIKTEVESHNLPCELINIVDLKLPLYDTELEKNGIPQPAHDLAQKLSKSKGLIFVAPEYNGSVPPTFNNALAWISRTNKDWRICFNEKPAMIATMSGGGGHHVLMAMRHQLSFIGVNVLGRSVLGTSFKPANPESVKACINQLIKHSHLS
ncbi:MAG: hypothetical protein COW00_10760 [Bdellovibrio sp. CG12_big_fil_rev_8_21_14_0_65_39_13]|nr:MAG: hypothetical protein COW78_13615 [Bdellovibrio sp. CG22_combo_CG10-13_8_21_14_all_39_27]PIQ59429.1 MAG: hypothetical protein COW00_10760 [Bdellovibrio sp. CG12_big_fil_rev_8_21_14_0_65_39_13]PIR34915.1 MAG: hypothetical protein COV37_11685 [Bdellovibrio sp. CG11_big_fil_rev_8_21_14_0_20_39_38]